jgi:hypothetical protein
LKKLHILHGKIREKVTVSKFKLTQVLFSWNFFKQFIIGMNVNHGSAGSTCKNMKLVSSRMPQMY